jgi:hypothetical protein
MVMDDLVTLVTVGRGAVLVKAAKEVALTAVLREMVIFLLLAYALVHTKVRHATWKGENNININIATMLLIVAETFLMFM